MGELCLQHGQKFVLIGDSITDCGRQAQDAPYGNGYVSMLRALVISGWPERDLQWVNKGIGGNTIADLQARWEDDVIREQPDWLSIKIGINDIHNYLEEADTGISPERFRSSYEELLNRTAARTSAKLILITPFYISTDHAPNSRPSQVLGLLPEYLATVEAMASQYGARLVNLHQMFQRQLTYRAPEKFCPEPVHPNAVGHLLIAREILGVLTG